MAQEIVVEHPFDPIYASTSKILILGSLPSVASREQAFYYGHPRNRFWKVLSAIFQEKVPSTIEEKKAFLMAHDIALWDVIAKCKIQGSSDATIREVEVTDLNQILKQVPIQAVFCNGTTALRYYHKFQEPITHLPAKLLPSTSPANASYSLEALIEKWKIPLLSSLNDQQKENKTQDKKEAKS